MREKVIPPRSVEALALARELRILLGNFKRRMRDHTQPGDLTLVQISVLARLDREGPATVSTLAREAGVRPQSMGATIAALEAAGLVRGAADPADGRQTILSLTDACREVIAASRLAREDWLLNAIETKLTPAQQAELARAVALLQRLVE
ncbi:MAG: MarR family transcriptional regulator [Methylovirgula sp.]|nr:MarR family transcriptional regulator [Methylovirgula sp.]